ncbi:hypothetical protein WN55_10419 [Dufourea novaeangliae]|uniref:Uncharacterized protein n=1 Tax=Dufourea novaeangliae TaxID=178035 RepID=A0A154P5P1_DUFNO|nr:hypothetical protein WN55_10419 [Dufourea novaeangliae]
MSTVFPAILLTSLLLIHIASEFSGPTQSTNYFFVSSFLEKWANATRTGRLAVVFDDYSHVDDFDVPRGVLDRFNVSARLVTLKHLISQRQERSRGYDQSFETESCVLLVFTDIDHLRDTLSSPHLVPFWQPENLYILQEQGPFRSDDHERFCEWAFARLWRLRRINRLVLFTTDKIIRYNPFTSVANRLFNNSCDWRCMKSLDDDFLVVTKPNGTDLSNLFVNDRRSFDKYTLKVSIFQSTTMTKFGNKYGGIDYKYLEEITRMMNVTPVLFTTKDQYGWRENGTFFGVLGHLVHESSDVSFNQFFVKDYLTRQIDFTAAFTADKLCVVVPKAPPVPDYLVIVKTFSGGAWLLIFAGHFFIAVIYTTLKGRVTKEKEIVAPEAVERIQNESGRCECPSKRRRLHVDQRETGFEIVAGSRGKRDHSGTVYPPETIRAEGSHSGGFERAALSSIVSLSKYITTVVLQLMQPFEGRNSGHRPRFPVRLFVMCSLWLGLILNGLFTSQLASILSKRMYYDDIDTLKELEESGLAILTGSRDIIEDALTDVTSPVMRRLHARMLYANETEINRRLFETRDAGYLQRLTTLPIKYNERQRRNLHIVKECPKEYVVANVMTKG